MKRVFFLLFAVAVLATNTTMAYDFSAIAPSGQTLYYDILEGGKSVSVVAPYIYGYGVHGWAGVTRPSGNLIIPNLVTYGGQNYTVKAINAEAFFWCPGLTSVTIPNSVTSIGDGAFSDCDSLTSVYFNADSCIYTSYGNFKSAFENDTNLINFNFGNIKIIPKYICYGLTQITNITIPNSVTTIGDGAFYGCTGLTSVTISNSVTTIGTCTFLNCTGLTSVTIPNSVTTIGYCAFSGCTGLTLVTIPNSVTFIGDRAFYCSGLTSVTIPNSVTTIGYCAFSGCTGLTSVTIPNSVTTIDYGAFQYCTGLTSVTIGSGVTEIGDYAFQYCTGLTSVNFNADSCISAGYGVYRYAFMDCTNLTNFKFGNNIKIIPRYICYGLTKITNITIPNSVTTIGNNAFSGCTGLTSVTIPNSVTDIDHAFYGCTGLTSVNFNADSCIYALAFMDCTNLTNIKFGNNIKIIPQYICYGLTKITNIAIPNSVTTIGDGAFYGCTGLTSVTIPNSVTSIGGYAFSETGLTKIIIPNSVTFIGNSAFEDCFSLDSVGNINLINRIEAKTFKKCAFRGELRINPHVIGNNAFEGCAYLTSIVLGDNVDSIYSGAFSKCSNVSNLSFGSGLKYIGSAAFKEMERVTSITCNSEEAPYVQNVDAFDGVPVNTPITIPCNTLNKYQYAYGWNRFTNFQSKMLYTFNVSSADPSKGSVQVMTQPTCENMQAYFQANAYNGFHFDHWSDGNTDNPRYLVLTGDTTIYAHFEVIQGISDVEKSNRCIIHAEDNRIVVSNTVNQRIRLFDCVGRCLSSVESPDDTYIFEIQSSGIYFVQVGNKRAQKVVVIR